MLLLRLRQLAALALTVAILAGIPYLLTAVVAWPEVDLSWLSIQAHLRGWRLPPGVVTTVLLAALWGVWALYLFALLAETAAWLRRGPVRLRPLGPAQVLAATALGTVTTTSVGAAPALAETVATAPDHTDSAEENQPSQAVEQQATQDTEPAYEQRERDRTVSGFGYDSAQVTDQMRADLASTIELIAEHGAPETPIVITGYTDAAGDADYNQELSERRAEAMADYLREVLGDQAPAIETRGRGEEEPLADVDDAAQRRVEITYTIATPVPAESEPAPEPTSSDNGEESGAILGLPSGAVTGLAASAAAAAGAAGGYAFGARRRPAVHSAPEAGHRFSTAASSSSTAPTATENPEEPAEPVETGVLFEDGHEPQQPDAPTAIAPRVLAALTQSPGVGLEGSNAYGAARALLATALATADTEPDLRPVICADDARHLLGEPGAALLAERDTPGVALTDSFPAALTTMHTTMVERQHQLDHAEADTLAELRTHNADQAQATPPVVLLARFHPDHEADLSGLLLAADGLDITAVILGRWLLGGTLTIDDGTITDTSPPLAPLHGAAWPAASAQHLQDLLNARPHRTSAAAPEPEPLSSTTTDHTHDHGHDRKGERVPQPAAAAPADVDQPAAAPPEPPDTGPPVGPPVEDTASAAPASSPPERGEPSPPVEDEHPDHDHAGEAAHGEDAAGGQGADGPPPPPGADEELRAAPAPGPSPQEHGERPIQVQLMSRIRITVEGSRVELPRRAAYELAAYLALHHTDGVRLESAVADMWPEEDPRRTTRRFHDAARTLRRTRDPGQEEAAEEPITRESEVYRLNPAIVTVDLWELQDALDEAEHTDDLARRHSLLQTVAHLYTGDLAAEAEYPWILPVRTRLRHRVTHALRRHAETVATEHPDVATVVLDRAVDIDPDDEDLHAALMRHHLHHGDTEAARRAFTRYTDRMRQIGTRPNPHLRDLIEKTHND